MTTIDLTIEKSRRVNAIKRARERNIIIPTYAHMKDPSKIPAKVKDELKGIGLWDIHPRNLFRITWKNEPTASGGTLWRGQLPRTSLFADRSSRAHHRAGRQVVPDGRAQGRGGVRLSGAAAGHRSV
jgi:hypothetical protein